MGCRRNGSDHIYKHPLPKKYRRVRLPKRATCCRMDFPSDVLLHSGSYSIGMARTRGDLSEELKAREFLRGLRLCFFQRCQLFREFDGPGVGIIFERLRSIKNIFNSIIIRSLSCLPLAPHICKYHSAYLLHRAFKSSFLKTSFGILGNDPSPFSRSPPPAATAAPLSSKRKLTAPPLPQDSSLLIPALRNVSRSYFAVATSLLTTLISALGWNFFWRG